MPPWQRVYVAACAGIAAFCLTYLAVDYLRVPRLTYHQLARVWRFQANPGGPLPSGYVGAWLWALALGALAAGGAALLTRLRPRALGEAGLGLGAAWAGTAFLLAGAYYTWNNWP